MAAETIQMYAFNSNAPKTRFGCVFLVIKASNWTKGGGPLDEGGSFRWTPTLGMWQPSGGLQFTDLNTPALTD